VHDLLVLLDNDAPDSAERVYMIDKRGEGEEVMFTIKDAWEKLEAEAIPASASDHARKLYRRVFYAGAIRTLHAIAAVSDRCDGDNAEVFVATVDAEAEQWVADLRAGKV